MILVDTSFLLAVVNSRDNLHARALAWAQQIVEPLVVTEQVVWEVVNAYSQPADRPKAHAIVTRLRSNSDCEWIAASTGLLDEGLKLHQQRADKEWSLTDCISFVVMQQRGITRSLTHDHHFEQAGFEALLRRDPP
ncbi:MAG: type II toxin-antitoxin system VapC family toxin [Planctomycetales bacterium]|nr:type II toxin-antitoxin system VapC family toxin [Planctomycetales bacterium]